MNASDVMTTPVITVNPFTPLREIVALLIDHRISGVPVLDNGQLVGMVGEGDLLHRHEIGTDEWLVSRTLWQRLLNDDPAPQAYVKSHGRRARDIMSREAATVEPDTPVARIASILEARDIRRLPVLERSRLVGIVTRGDLVRALADKTRDGGASRVQTDEMIRLQLVAELEKQPWWQAKWSSVFVSNGIVRYRGLYERESDRQAARVAAENVPGVRAVEDGRVLSESWQPMV